MKTPWVLAGIVLTIGAVAMIKGCSGTSGRMGSLPWPPDTIRAVRVANNTYEVTTSPAARDPRMKVLFIWPPDTTIVVFPRSLKSAGWVPETTYVPIRMRPGVESPSFKGPSGPSTVPPAPSVLTWPPDTTEGWILPVSYPSEILLVWPPDTI